MSSKSKSSLLCQWEQLTTEEVMEKRLFNENRKKCPNCGAWIFKDGGCLPIECYSCHHKFCWLCMKPYEEHEKTYYKCKNYCMEDDIYLKKPDNISYEFISQYNDVFEIYKHRYNFYIKNKEIIISSLESCNKTPRDVAEMLVNEMQLAYTSMQHAEILLFFERRRQLEKEGIKYEEQATTDLKPDEEYIAIETKLKSLAAIVAEVDDRIESIKNGKENEAEQYNAKEDCTKVESLRNQLQEIIKDKF